MGGACCAISTVFIFGKITVISQQGKKYRLQNINQLDLSMTALWSSLLSNRMTSESTKGVISTLEAENHLRPCLCVHVHGYTDEQTIYICLLIKQYQMCMCYFYCVLSQLPIFKGIDGPTFALLAMVLLKNPMTARSREIYFFSCGHETLIGFMFCPIQLPNQIG